MGVLSITPESDVMTYIRDLYSIDVGVSRSHIHWPSLNAANVHSGNVSDYICDFIGRQPLTGAEQEVINKALLFATVELFKRKYENGLYKSFSVTWAEVTNGWVVRSIDDQRNTHIKLILKHKRYGFIQKTKGVITGFLKQTRR